MSSPSEFIYNILNINKDVYLNREILINDLKDKKIIDHRIKDLSEQKILTFNMGNYHLSTYGKIIFYFFKFLSKISKINIQG